MARLRRTDLRARHALLSGDFPALAKGGSWYEMLESFPYISWLKAGILLTGGLLILCWSAAELNGNRMTIF